MDDYGRNNDPRNPRLLSEVGKGDFPTEGVHDDKTGMFTIPDPERASAGPDGMILDAESGLFLPSPKYKPIRVMLCSVATLQVNETPDQIKAAIRLSKSDDHDDWYEFTNPTYGTPVHVPAEVLRMPIVISWDVVDLENVELAQRQYEMQKSNVKLAGLKSGIGRG